MGIVKAEKSDHEILSTITKLSKAHWGYSNEQMKLWDDELTISANYIESNIVFKLIVKNKTVAYYSLEIQSAEKILLENLFVLPEYIGKGYGKLMLHDSIEKARRLKFKEMVLEADPHATDFYKKNGFEIIGRKATSIKDRFMPVMRKSLL